MSKAAKDLVDEKIAGKKVVMFSKSWCPYCEMAKEALQPYIGDIIPEDEYEIIEIETMPDCAGIETYLQNLTGVKTVPRVFIGGKCHGGGTEIKKMHQSGELKEILSSV